MKTGPELEKLRYWPSACSLSVFGNSCLSLVAYYVYAFGVPPEPHDGGVHRRAARDAGRVRTAEEVAGPASAVPELPGCEDLAGMQVEERFADGLEPGCIKAVGRRCG